MQNIHRHYKIITFARFFLYISTVLSKVVKNYISTNIVVKIVILKSFWMILKQINYGNPIKRKIGGALLINELNPSLNKHGKSLKLFI